MHNKVQHVPDFMLKCIQLYEMTTVRHGMMLVGPTGGGKTAVRDVLQQARRVVSHTMSAACHPRLLPPYTGALEKPFTPHFAPRSPWFCHSIRCTD